MEIVEGNKLKSKRFYVTSLGLGGLSGVGLSTYWVRLPQFNVETSEKYTNSHFSIEIRVKEDNRSYCSSLNFEKSLRYLNWNWEKKSWDWDEIVSKIIRFALFSEENSAKPQPVKNQDGGLDFEKKIRENRKRIQSKFKTEKNRFKKSANIGRRFGIRTLCFSILI